MDSVVAARKRSPIAEYTGKCETSSETPLSEVTDISTRDGNLETVDCRDCSNNLGIQLVYPWSRKLLGSKKGKLLISRYILMSNVRSDYIL